MTNYENVHLQKISIPLTERIGISWGVGGSVRPNNLKKCMKLNWNFQLGGGEGVRKKSLLWGRYGYFLELHNNKSIVIAIFTVDFAHLHYNEI